LCNGSNGTPDLRNKFIIGANSDAVVGINTAATNVTGSNTKVGGSKDAVVVSHSHTGTTDAEGSHSHAVVHDTTGNGALNSINYAIAKARNDNIDDDYLLARADNTNDPTLGKTNTVGSHTHNFTTNSTGESGTNMNLPPYYALAFIMRVS
jgi:hypothetical protein